MEALYSVQCTARGCDLVLLLCRRCYRGPRYCSESCRQRERREQRRAAQKTYLSDQKGRRRAAAAAKAYRRRSAGTDRPASRSKADSPPAEPSSQPESKVSDASPSSSVFSAAFDGARADEREPGQSPADPSLHFVIDQGLPTAQDERYASIPRLRCVRCRRPGWLRRSDERLRGIFERASHDP